MAPQADGSARQDQGEALTRLLSEQPDTGSLDAIFIDLSGVVRGKRYPREDMAKLLNDGMQIPFSVYLLDVTGESLDPCGYGFTDGDPDGTALPLPGSLMPVPWAERPRAQALMTMFDGTGAPCWFEPRNVAAKALQRLADKGLSPTVAFELEFHLLDPEPDAAGRPRPAAAPVTGRRHHVGQVYGMTELDDFDPFFAAVERAAQQQGIPASVATKEYSAGQFEINLHHQADALAAADHCALLRYLIQRVAASQGMRATFLSKPFPELTGNGMHLHLSLMDESGRNRFDNGSELGSESLRHAIGGLAAAMPESMAFFAPNLNAYRRFGPNLFVPVTKSWGVNNRSFAFRIPTGPSAARRVEHRIAGADANPYLVLAAVVAAIDHGLENALDPGPPWSGNATAEPDPEIPLSLPDALRQLDEASRLAEAMEPRYLRLYAETKRLEYQRFMAEISPREYRWYL